MHGGEIAMNSASRLRFVVLLALAFAILAFFFITQALAGPASDPRSVRVPLTAGAPAQSSSGVEGAPVTKVKTYQGVAYVVKSTTFVNVATFTIATGNNQNQIVRIRFSASIHCRAMNAAGSNQACSVRFLVDGSQTSVNPFVFGRADFMGSQSMEDWRVFFDDPGTHTVAIQARSASTNVWFYLDNWTATIERINNAVKL
jgi:hypothetical protein